MTVLRPAYFQSAVKLECRTCGAQTGAACNCGDAYDVVSQILEKDAERREKARKLKQKQRSRPLDTPDAEYADTAAAERAEARCAADWKAFTAQEERNAVSNILESIRGLTDEQRALLFQTLKDSYQWT